MTDFEDPALWLGPRLAWKVGRFLMQLDIALRRLGYEDEIDATIAMLRDVAVKNETRQVVSVLKRDWQALASSYAPGLGEDVRRSCLRQSDGNLPVHRPGAQEPVAAAPQTDACRGGNERHRGSGSINGSTSQPQHLIRRLGRSVQDCPGISTSWDDFPGLSSCIGG